MWCLAFGKAVGHAGRYPKPLVMRALSVGFGYAGGIHWCRLCGALSKGPCGAFRWCGHAGTVRPGENTLSKEQTGCVQTTISKRSDNSASSRSDNSASVRQKITSGKRKPLKLKRLQGQDNSTLTKEKGGLCKILKFSIR